MSVPTDASFGSAEQSDTTADLDWEKWRAEKIFRDRELNIKDREFELKIEQDRRSRWTSPLVIAILGAALAAGGNAGITWFNANEQRELENARAEASRAVQRNAALENLNVERVRAEASRILEAVKTQGDPDKAAANLQFLLDVKLIVDREIAEATRTYLSTRRGGSGISLPGNNSSTPPTPPLGP